MEYLPISLRVQDRRCLIVGGGEVAFRKATLLGRAGARLRVVAPDIDASFSALPCVERFQREYRAKDLHGVWVVVAATDDENLNARISADAESAGVPVNVVDDPMRCTFVMPALVDRSPILVAISSAGASPVLARTVRGDIEALLSPGLGPLADLLGRHRKELKRVFPDLAKRRAFVESILKSKVVELTGRGDAEAAEAVLLRRLRREGREFSTCADVYVVGVGPGDPDLLTFAAQRLMQQADRVFFELKSPEALLDRCRRDAHRNPLPDGALHATADMSELVVEVQGAIDRGERVALLVPGRGDGLLSSLEVIAQCEGWGLRGVPGVSVSH